MALLERMGWRAGEGLGRTKEGPLEPLAVDIKTDKRGELCLLCSMDLQVIAAS